MPGRGAAKLEKLNVSSVLVQYSSAQSVPRVWVKIEINPNIMARSVLPDIYSLNSMAISNNLMVLLQPLICYDFKFSWKTMQRNYLFDLYGAWICLEFEFTWCHMSFF